MQINLSSFFFLKLQHKIWHIRSAHDHFVSEQERPRQI